MPKAGYLPVDSFGIYRLHFRNLFKISGHHSEFGLPSLVVEDFQLMLRISYAETPERQEWILSGRLSGSWVEELRSLWRQAHERGPRPRAVVDLRDVTFIDESGENLLAEICSDEAEFLVAGVENRHVLDTLQYNGKRL
jgi:hypothetical protein